MNCSVENIQTANQLIMLNMCADLLENPSSHSRKGTFYQGKTFICEKIRDEKYNYLTKARPEQWRCTDTHTSTNHLTLIKQIWVRHIPRYRNFISRKKEDKNDNQKKEDCLRILRQMRN